MSRPALPARPEKRQSTIQFNSQPNSHSSNPTTNNQSISQSNSPSPKQSTNQSSLPSSFVLPDCYHFPPFFTLQRNADTRVKQLQLWCDMIISLARTIATDPSLSQSNEQSNDQFIAPSPSGIRQSMSARCLIVHNSAQSTHGTNALFTNKSLNRSLNNEAINAVCHSLIQTNHSVWLSGSQSTLLVSHRSITQWAQSIYQWANEFGHSLLTLYEIQTSVSSHDRSHYGLHVDMLHAALQHLQNEGKCQLIPGDTVYENGVKFKGI